jgi:hypothetical protein
MATHGTVENAPLPPRSVRPPGLSSLCAWRSVPLVALALALACAETPAPAPAQPAPAVTPEPQPATAVRLLLAHKDALELSPRQRDKLQAIDRDLETTNAPLEKKLHELESRPHPAAQAPPDRAASPPGGGAPGGARMGMGMGGGGRRGGGRGRGGRGGGGAGPSASVAKRPHDTESETVHAQMMRNHEAALAKAFDVLDLEQRARARQLLDDSDFEAPPEATEPSADGPAAP